MSPSFRKYGLLAVSVVLLFINIFLIRLELGSSQNVLTFAMLDVGQGDALFVESPAGTQILFDAGPARRILGPLMRVMSPFDRTIDAIVITNPDADHIGGFAEVLKHYEVGYVFMPGTENSSKTFENLKVEIEKRKVKKILARKGMRLHLGGGTVADILFPDRDVSAWSTNDGSIVARLSYGDTSILLTGDSTSKTEKIILAGDAPLQSDILKVGHHGSRSSSSHAFAGEVKPEYALISNGKANSYGHPHEEVLEVLEDLGAEILRTDMLGTIVMKSDGKKTSFSFYK